jgi:hypothetical protein
MKINTNKYDYRNIDLEQIQDDVFRAKISHIRITREGKEKRLLQRLRKEQSRQTIAVLSV